MMNVTLWNKKTAECLKIENVLKIERGKKNWFLYISNGNCSVREFAVFDLISVDLY